MCSRPLYIEEGVTFNNRWANNHPVDPVDDDAVVDFIVNQEDQQEAEQEQEQQQENAGNVPAEDEWDEMLNDGNFGGEVTMVQDLNELTSIQYAPGEGNRPIGLLRDPKAEYLSFPTLYCGFMPNLPPRTTYAAQCKYELQHYDSRFRKAVHNILYKVQRLTMCKLNSAIGIAMRQGRRDGRVTAGNLLNDEDIAHFIHSDAGKQCLECMFLINKLFTIAILILGFRIVKSLRNSPAFWEARMKEGMAMLRQLGTPTFFLTLSAAESNWNELIAILFRVASQTGEVITIEQAKALPADKKAELIRNDPVTCASYFSHRSGKLMAFLKTDSSPLIPNKVSDSIQRVEFQHRGSPHLHTLLWTTNSEATGDEPTGPPQYKPYDSNSENDCVAFINKYITCSAAL